MQALLLIGVYSNIPALHEFSVIASVSVFTDFMLQACVCHDAVDLHSLQVIFYVAVLSVDIRRMELSDLSRPRHLTQSYRVFRSIDSSRDNSALEKALKDTSGLTTIVLNSSFVLLSMVWSRIVECLVHDSLRAPPCSLRCSAAPLCSRRASRSG